MASAIRPERILKELDELWVNLGQQSEGSGVLRACAMTLIVITPDEGADALGETLAKLMREHPSRLVVLRVQPGSEASLSERVLAQCWMPFGTRQQICCEQIEITTTEAGLKDVPPVVRALEAPDLPVVIWTRIHGLLLRPECAPLLALADKVIVDSQGYPHTQEKLAAIRATLPSRLVADLEWTRLTRWRNMLAQEFDNPAYLSRLHELQTASIGYDGSFVPMRALYLAGWLRSTLPPHVAITLERSGPAPTPRLHTITLSGGSLHFHINVEPTRASEMRICSQQAHPPMPALNDDELMREELGVTSRDAAFEASLAYATEIAE